MSCGSTSTSQAVFILPRPIAPTCFSALTGRTVSMDVALRGVFRIVDPEQPQRGQPVAAIEQVDRERSLGAIGRVTVVAEQDDRLLQPVALDVGSQILQLGLAHHRQRLGSRMDRQV